MTIFLVIRWAWGIPATCSDAKLWKAAKKSEIQGEASQSVLWKRETRVA